MNETLEIHHARSAIIWLRVISSFAWLDSALIGKDAKLSAAFLSGTGLVMTVTTKLVHTAITPGIVRLLQNVVVPHAQIFAVLIAVTDLAIGVSLLFGIFTRLGGALEIGRAVSNILIAGGAGADTVGFNSMLILAGVIVIATAAGRRYGVDRFLLARWPSSCVLRLIA